MNLNYAKRAEDNIKKLPDEAICRHLTEGFLMRVNPLTRLYIKVFDKFPANEFNRKNGVTPQQRDAMSYGALYGWHVVEADCEHEMHKDAREEI